MAQNKEKKEPLVRIAKKGKISAKQAWMYRILFVIAGLLVTGLFVLAATGINPLNLYIAMVRGTFKNKYAITKTIKYITVLLCLGVGLAPAFKMRFWNIGAQGQMLMGALAASVVALNYRDMKSGLLIPLMCLAAIVAGAVWGLLPAIFKAFWNTNETLFTLMLNYIAMYWVMYRVDDWKGESSGFASFKQIAPNAVMPRLFGENFYLSTIFVMILTAIMYVYMKRTKHGYELAVTGESENTARYAGINVRKVIIRTMIMSGAICGFCGFITASGIDFTLSAQMNSGYGFTAIVVAWLAKFNPFGMIGTSFMMIFFQNAATEISTMYPNDASTYLANIIQGIILFFILASEFAINYRLVFRKKTAKEVEA